MAKNVTMPMISRAAAVMPSSVNESARTAEVVFTTGAMVRRFDWLEGEYEEELVVSDAAIRMERLRNGAPLLADHSAYDIDDVHGVVERAWVQNGEGRALVRFASDAETETIWQKVKEGVLRNVSVGYMVHAYQEIKDGARRILRAIDWEPMEISLVAVPADYRAQVRSKSAEQVQCIIHRSHEDIMTTEANTADAEVEVAADAEAGAAAEPAADAAADQPAAEPAADAQVATEVRALEIMELCTLAGQPMTRAMEYVKGGQTVAEIRAALMAERANKIANEPQVDSHVTPPAEQKTGGTAQRMAKRFAGADKAAANTSDRMRARFSA